MTNFSVYILIEVHIHTYSHAQNLLLFSQKFKTQTPRIPLFFKFYSRDVNGMVFILGPCFGTVKKKDITKTLRWLTVYSKLKIR